MKKLTVLIVLLAAFSGAMAAGPKKSHDVSVLSTKRDIFYFKVSKAFVGATIEVYAASGEMIFTEKVTSRKSIVDFYLENPGHYTITLKKENKEEKFEYEKKHESALVPINVDTLQATITFSKQ